MLDKTASLTPLEKSIIVNGATETPFSGQYNTTNTLGTYLCRKCGLAVFRSSSKFLSSCGWPSFDDEIENSIKRLSDSDGFRTEIQCNRCSAHLGHVFKGERFTSKNLRHCVNSFSLDFANSTTVNDSEEIIVAGGCFWGLEHYLALEKGVIFTQVGYCGGESSNPSYKEVCSSNSGHYEVTRVIFDSETTCLKNILTAFLELHNPEQEDGQGNDIGQQYQSAIFCFTNDQKTVANELLAELRKRGYSPVTKITDISPFWAAENEHQKYLENNPNGYCNHNRVKRFK